MRPWVRNACSIDRWCAAPEVRRTLTHHLTEPSALVAGYFDRRAIEETLTIAFDRREVPIEVPMNLYRAELMLQRFRDIRLTAVSR